VQALELDARRGDGDVDAQTDCKTFQNTVITVMFLSGVAVPVLHYRSVLVVNVFLRVVIYQNSNSIDYFLLCGFTSPVGRGSRFNLQNSSVLSK
jgi:hypothetical protein